MAERPEATSRGIVIGTIGGTALGAAIATLLAARPAAAAPSEEKLDYLIAAQDIVVEPRPIVVVQDLAEILSRATEFSVATGDATDGSTTTLEDTSAVWEDDKWKDAVVEITHAADGKHYFVTITSNTADTLTFP
ncbi:unnamed protein product, partial [marine sediment metagenome]